MLNAVILVGGIGLVAALVLGVSSVTFAVQMDPREKSVLEQLPGANCGACGFAGCAAFAHELATNPEAQMDCPAVTADAQERIGMVLGREMGGAVAQVAVVRCSGSIKKAKTRFNYVGLADCAAAQLIAGGSKTCRYGCLGEGSCVSVCPFGAISMGKDGLPKVDEKLCTGCGKCADACPRHLIELVPADNTVTVGCMSQDASRDMKKICDVGCIKCGLCVNVCPFDAISIDGRNAAHIDPAKCRSCGLCADVCPAHVIEVRRAPAKAYVIEETCRGCSLCAQVCPVDAISGTPKNPYVIDENKCIGCGLCMEKCPADAIGRREI